MDGLKKDAIVYVFTKAERCICGRYVGERKGNVRIILQRKVIPDDKLLGKGVHDAYKMLKGFWGCYYHS